MAEAADATAHDPGHPTPRLYVQTAAVLFVLTAMEFSTYFIDFAVATVPLLVILMAIKFAIVAGIFMHLKYDTRLFTRMMGAGLGLAVGLYILTVATISEIPRNLGF